MVRSMLSYGGSRVERAEFLPPSLICVENSTIKKKKKGLEALSAKHELQKKNVTFMLPIKTFTCSICSSTYRRKGNLPNENGKLVSEKLFSINLANYCAQIF